ncbi:phosphate ABC transporter substrate-binding/OmpA family protein [Epibacterium ulvae]|uniref:phosphate ABC transporter substrate-binding/OmpA family protein n=1 Tax=Epibacterium ulvae TaxID=1156985 RepID=UPI002491CD49|nr:phosphate ABC transporter substrate-binding/OmpA family protein [Epibacterium ulvae]
MAVFRAALAAALLFFSHCVSALAQDVTLSSQDGSVEINGDLLGFDGEFYRVNTKFGELTVDGSGVRCDGPGCPSLSDFVAEISFSGSTAMADVLIPALIEGFSLRNGFQTHRDALGGGNFEYTLREAGGRIAARFSFFVSNTDDGFEDLLNNETDIVLALREIRPAERQRAEALGMGDMTSAAQSRVVALDALVPVVSPDNPVRDITLPQLVGVLTGQISNWQTLGGPDAPITVHLPVAASGLTQAIQDRLLGTGSLAQNVRRHDRLSNLGRRVATDSFAFGITSFSEADPARKLILSGSCGFELQAGRRAIKTEDYPLNAPMFLYLPARRLPKIARDFLSYTRGPGAQIVIRRAGFVDQAAETITLNAQGDRLANAILSGSDEIGLDELNRMVSTLKGHQRLTTSFRFEAGSSRPDAQSRSNIEQLARALEAGAYDTRELLFVGFSDGQGPAAGNRDIAFKRAQAVRDAVLATAETANLDRVTLSTDAFGEAMPMACDDSAWGRQVNRRVEVWVR